MDGGKEFWVCLVESEICAMCFPFLSRVECGSNLLRKSGGICREYGIMISSGPCCVSKSPGTAFPSKVTKSTRLCQSRATNSPNYRQWDVKEASLPTIVYRLTLSTYLADVTGMIVSWVGHSTRVVLLGSRTYTQ